MVTLQKIQKIYLTFPSSLAKTLNIQARLYFNRSEYKKRTVSQSICRFRHLFKITGIKLTSALTYRFKVSTYLFYHMHDFNSFNSPWLHKNLFKLDFYFYNIIFYNRTCNTAVKPKASKKLDY